METQIIDQMSAALGEDIISLLADWHTLAIEAIERGPRTDTVWVFQGGEKWQETPFKISDEAVARFIAAVGAYRGIPISDDNPDALLFPNRAL